MQTILTLREQDINPDVPEVERGAFTHRVAVRAVVMDGDGQVALMHASKRGYYKLPGGGVDAGEELMAALARELMEELGCKAGVTGELGQVIEYRDYWQMKQTSHCYAARLVGDIGQPDLTPEEQQQGFEVTWHKNIEAAIKVMTTQTPTDEDMDIKFMQRRDIAILAAAKKS